MCTNKIIVRNNSRYIVPDDHVALYHMCNCGYCAECMQAKINEYTLRLHYHSQYCFKRHGYLYIDCLTYSDRYLPRLHEFIDVPLNYAYKCFCHEDVRLFFVRLRENLFKLGFGRDCFDYFYVGEFGSRNTKRPHYHVIFFVYADIDNDTFSRLVSANWYLGRTDGVVYRGYNQLVYNTINPENSDNRRIAAISTYLAKYLNKSMKLIKKAYRLTSNVVFHLFGVHDLKDLTYPQRLVWRSVFSRFVPFHRQSKNFGLYALQVVPKEYICMNLKIFFLNGEEQFIIPLPLYYTRKLFFKLEKNVFGSYSWIPTPEYQDLMLRSFADRINYAVDKIRCDCLTYHVDFPFDIRQFVLDLRLAFGRTNFTDYNDSLRSDLSRNPNVDVLKLGFYNYTHPRFGLGVLSDRPLVIDHVKLSVVVKKRLKTRTKIKYVKTKCVKYVNSQNFEGFPSQNSRIMDYEAFAKTFTHSAQSFLVSHNFYSALRLFCDSFCRANIPKKRSQDLKQLVSQTLKNLFYAN